MLPYRYFLYLKNILYYLPISTIIANKLPRSQSHIAHIIGHLKVISKILKFPIEFLPKLEMVLVNKMEEWIMC